MASSKDRKKKRQIDYLNPLERIYLFCEGEQTEPLYFKGFEKAIKNNPIYKNLVHIHIEGVGAETLRVIYYAEEYVKQNNIKGAQIWCVYDKDSFPAERFNGVVERAEKLNKENLELQYHTAWSNECIEFWFLLHFTYYTSNNDRNEYKEFLNKKFKELELGKYEKKMENIFKILLEKGSPKLAIRYAKRIIKDGQGKTPTEIAPGTKVYELVEELAKYLPEEVKRNFS